MAVAASVAAFFGQTAFTRRHLRSLMLYFDALGIASTCFEAKPPEQHRRGGRLDEAVEPESEERDALGLRPKPDREAGFDDVVDERDADEPDADSPPVSDGQRSRGDSGLLRCARHRFALRFFDAAWASAGESC